MENITTYKKVYFIGIGGIGMSALASWFHEAGYVVAGYDRTPSAITLQLQNDGIPVTFLDAITEIPPDFKQNKDEVLVVYTPAVPVTHQGLSFFQEHGFTVIKRSQALGLLVKDKLGIAVAGTHGKTSVSTNIAWLMKQSASAFLGGMSKNLESNVLISPLAQKVVVEADEFDRSFLTLYPEIAVLTAIDADHLDIYGSKDELLKAFESFIAQVKHGGKVLLNHRLVFNKKVNPNITYYTYGMHGNADYHAQNIKINQGFYHFDLVTPQKTITDLKLGVPGLYNLENAVAAVSVALLANTPLVQIQKQLESYQGVKRRFDFHIKTENLVLIDDYAHHPEEIKACIRSVRELYPDKKIVGAFQPHLYSRTNDFYLEFAESLDLFDEMVLTDIYPAREEPIEGVSSRLILKHMKNKHKSHCTLTEMAEVLAKKDAEVFVMMGAGDIERQIVNVKSKLLDKLNE